MITIITAVCNRDFKYIKVVNPKAITFVEDTTDATKFPELCERYLDAILNFLRDNFEDYKFRAVAVNHLLFQDDENYFNRENFDIEAFER